MKFLCGSCRTKYQISDEKVRGKILTIRCKKCGAKILVRESLARDPAEGTVVAPLADEGAAPASGASPLSDAFDRALAGYGTIDVSASVGAPVVAHEWYTAIDGQQLGPFSFEQVERQIQHGQLIGRHYVWHEGMDNWTRIRDVPGLERHLPVTTIPPPPPPPEPRQRAAPPVLMGVPEPESSTEELAADALFSEHFAVGGVDASRPISVAEGPGDEPSASADESAELPAGEDLFANVPRASAAELVQKETTRFFVKAAGLANAKARTRWAIGLGGALLLLIGGFVGAWAAGIVRVELPGIGNPFVRSERRAQLYDGEGEDPNDVKGLLSGERQRRAEQLERRRQAARRRAAAAAAGPNAEPSDFEYVDVEDYEAERGSRGAEGFESIGIGELGTAGVGDGRSVVDADLPTSDLEQVPAVDRSSLSTADIQRTVNTRKRSVKICYEQSLRGQDSLRGKLEIRVTIDPSGKVSDTEIETAAFKGSQIGKCIADKIAEWRFPSFDGEPENILVPFILERSAY